MTEKNVLIKDKEGNTLYPQTQASLVLTNNGSDVETALDSKANDSEVVHLANAETITGAKSFTGPVNLIGSGDSNAVGISTNTRFNVHNTNKTVLGFGNNLFYINHGDYRLRLRGKDTRPHYNSDSNYLALLSDVPDVSNFATKSEIPTDYATKTELEAKQDTLTAGENITIQNGVISSTASGGLSYEDLNEEIEVNPTSLIEDWQAYQQQVNTDMEAYKQETNTLVEFYKQQVNDLQAELAVIKSVRYVVETWHDGANWYTLYSDGWCEQGGLFAYVANGTVGLHKAYGHLDYTVMLTDYDASDTGGLAASTGLAIPYEDSFKISTTSEAAAGIFWETKGYIL